MTPITEVEGRRLALSNLDKVLYADSGFTKGEVLHYYATAAGALLPHLRDRPVSFLRFPDGPDGQRFFAKNVPPGTPTWVRTAEVRRSDGVSRQIVVQDLATLMWAANLVTEFHTHQWLVDTPEETTLHYKVMLPDANVWGPGPYPAVIDYSGYLPAQNVYDGLDDRFIEQGYAVVGLNIRGSACSSTTWCRAPRRAGSPPRWPRRSTGTTTTGSTTRTAATCCWWNPARSTS